MEIAYTVFFLFVFFLVFWFFFAFQNIAKTYCAFNIMVKTHNLRKTNKQSNFKREKFNLTQHSREKNQKLINVTYFVISMKYNSFELSFSFFVLISREILAHAFDCMWIYTYTRI